MKHPKGNKSVEDQEIGNELTNNLNPTQDVTNQPAADDDSDKPDVDPGVDYMRWSD